MTESDWLTSTDPQAMLAFLDGNGRASGRKFRLFAVVCCRRSWHLMTDASSWRVAEIAEQHADVPVDGEQLRAARRNAYDKSHCRPDASAQYTALYDALNAARSGRQGGGAVGTGCVASLYRR
jgi:hypothetical protein